MLSVKNFSLYSKPLTEGFEAAKVAAIEAYLACKVKCSTHPIFVAIALGVMVGSAAIIISYKFYRRKVVVKNNNKPSKQPDNQPLPPSRSKSRRSVQRERLLEMIKNGSLDGIKNYFKTPQCSVNSVIQNKTPLQHAFDHKQNKIIIFFINHGADLMVEDDQERNILEKALILPKPIGKIDHKVKIKKEEINNNVIKALTQSSIAQDWFKDHLQLLKEKLPENVFLLIKENLKPSVPPLIYLCWKTSLAQEKAPNENGVFSIAPREFKDKAYQRALRP